MHDVLIIGDLHLGKTSSIGKYIPGSVYNGRIIDQINNLDWIISVIQENLINYVIFTGDIFESSKPDYYLIEIFVNFLHKISEFGVESHIVIGNHDLKKIGNHFHSPLYFIDLLEINNVHFHKNVKTVLVNKTYFTFLPFYDRKFLNCEKNSDALLVIKNFIENELKNVEKERVKVLVGHLSIEGAFYVGDEIDDVLNELFCPIQFFKDYNFVWMGHVHKPQILNKIPHVAHVGSFDFSGFEEANQNKISILFDSNSGSYKELPNKLRPLKKIFVEVKENEDPNIILEEEIKNHDLKNSIIKIEVITASQILLNKNQIEQSLYDSGVYYISDFIEKRNLSLQKLDSKNNNVVCSTEPEKAIEFWSNKIESEEDRNLYLKFAKETLFEFKERQK